MIIYNNDNKDKELLYGYLYNIHIKLWEFDRWR